MDVAGIGFRAYLKRLLRFLVFMSGLVIASVGILLTINTTWGVSPWDVLHKALANRFGMQFGTVQEVVGLAVLLLTLTLGGRKMIRPGTVINVVVIGQCINWFSQWFGWFPVRSGWTGLVQLVVGISCMAIGIALYLSARLGAGPRDGLLLTLVGRTKLPVWVVQVSLDGLACLSGTLLGGPVGFGTVVYVLLYGINLHFFYGIARRWFALLVDDPSMTPAAGAETKKAQIAR